MPLAARPVCRYFGRVLSLALHEWHRNRNATFTSVNDCEIVVSYADPLAEHQALRQTAAVLDLGFRSRLCVLGNDRERFLNGQVTNDVKALRPGEGCYAALVTAKGRMDSDLYVYRLADEFLLDFEPGFTAAVGQRLDRYIIADDVQVADASPHYGLLSVQGPKAAEVVSRFARGVALPDRPLAFTTSVDARMGGIYLVNQPRVGLPGFDLFVPTPNLAVAAEELTAAAAALGGRPAGWEALEWARVEAGVPRFGADMDGRNLPPEAGLEARAISYRKGCYIGQEVIARIRTYGRVAKALRGLRLADDLPGLPSRGSPLHHAGQEVGFVTSAVHSPTLDANLALGYVRRSSNDPGVELTLRTPAGESPVRIVPLPFVTA